MAFRRNRSRTWWALTWARYRNLHSAFLRDGEAALKLSGKGGRYHAYRDGRGRSIVA